MSHLFRNAARSAYRVVGDRRAGVAMFFSIASIPLVGAVGGAIDYARLATERQALQDAADIAALSGASAYVTDMQQDEAVDVATKSVLHALSPTGLSIALARPVEAGAGKIPATGDPSKSVTVAVKETVPLTFMAMLTPSITLQATATAANPTVTMSLGVPPSGNANAGDWNSVWMYTVPVADDGTPQYASQPVDKLKFIELWSNCKGVVSNAWCRDYEPQDFITPHGITDISATQPIAFALKNQTSGRSAKGTGYGTTQYGSPIGNINWFYSAPLVKGLPPSYYTNTENQAKSPMVKTKFPTGSNCSMQIVPVGSTVYKGCLSPQSKTMNYQLSSLTCAQAYGATVNYYWNDMGGPSDDTDYDDLVLQFTCKTNSGSNNTSVQLIR